MRTPTSDLWADAVSRTLLKGGTSEGAERGWETRRGRAAVEYKPRGRERGQGEDEPEGRGPAAAESGGPQADRISVDWLPGVGGATAAEEEGGETPQGFAGYDSGATFDSRIRERVRGMDGQEHAEGGDYLVGRMRERLSRLPDHHLTGAAIGQIRVTGRKEDLRAGLEERWDELWPPETRRGKSFDMAFENMAGMYFDAAKMGEGTYGPVVCVTEDWTGNPPDHVQTHEFAHALMHNMKGPDNPRDPGVGLSHRASDEDVAEHRAWRKGFAEKLREHVGTWDAGPDLERPEWETLWEAIWDTEIEPLAKQGLSPIPPYAGVDKDEGFAEMYAVFSRQGRGVPGKPGGRRAGADIIKKHLPGTWDFMNVLFNMTKMPEWRAPEPAKAEAR